MVDVIIPVYHPDHSLRTVIEKLIRQSVPPHRIILMNTEEALWKPELAEGFPQVEVYHVTKAEFDHAATRRQAAELSDADYMMFMTQDAIPADDLLIESLLGGLKEEQIAGVFARQLPKEDCNVVESYTRSFNYPDKSYVRTREDIGKMGIRAFFFSDVCAVYRKKTYEELGGFVKKAIFNEDMFYAAKALESGWKMGYVAEAKVYHSHNYTNIQYLKRNFDMGVSQAEQKEVFEGISSEKEGMKLVKKTCTYLFRTGKWDAVIKLFLNSGFKWMGYRLGKSYRHLPHWLVCRLTSNPAYWQ